MQSPKSLHTPALHATQSAAPGFACLQVLARSLLHVLTHAGPNADCWVPRDAQLQLRAVQPNSRQHPLYGASPLTLNPKPLGNLSAVQSVASAAAAPPSELVTAELEHNLLQEEAEASSEIPDSMGRFRK